MKIGITGTRSGMTPKQLNEVYEFLKNQAGRELHHGDCIGADSEVAAIAKDLQYRVVCHPPTKFDLREFTKCNDETREPASYFARNRNIVDECDLLMVVPYQNERQLTGGTWYTHDYAVKTDTKVKIFYPN